jgi:hypothetical protein
MSPKKSKRNYNKYQSALSLLFYEGQIAWQLNILFIGLNVGIGTVISSSLLRIHSDCILIFVFSLIGILINLAWLGTFRRNNKYYHFRMAQAREAEPKRWQLLSRRGYKFSKGQEIFIDDIGTETLDSKHMLDSFEKFNSNKFAIGLAIWIFILGFIFLFFASTYFLFQNICS